MKTATKEKPFRPLVEGDMFGIQRLCKCKTTTKCRKRCGKWRWLGNESRDEKQAFQSTIEYLRKYRPEIFKTGIVNDEYAFYRITRESE